MTEPLYDPEIIFTTASVVDEESCWYCPLLIDPKTDEEYFIITIPGEAALDFHVSCFEEFTWLMFTHYHRYIYEKGQEKEKVLGLN